MKFRLFLVVLLASLPALPVLAQSAAPTAPGEVARPTDAAVTEELTALVNRIKAKIGSGARTADALAPELVEFDRLLAKFGAEKTDVVAGVALMRAGLYIQVFEDYAKGRELLLALKRDFPDTQPAMNVDAV